MPIKPAILCALLALASSDLWARPPGVVERSTELLRAGKFEAASRLLERALERSPRLADGWYNLAYALRKSGRLDRSLEAYRTYARLRPAAPDPYYGIGLALRAKNAPAQAARAFRRYAELETRPERRSWVEKARRLAAELEQQTPPSASGGAATSGPQAPAPSSPSTTSVPAQAFDDAAPISAPEFSAAMPAGAAERLRVQGDTLARNGRYEQAQQLYRQALSQDPFLVAAYDGLAYTAFKAGQPRVGIRQLSVALRDNPDYHRGWLHLARLYRLAGDASAAAGYYRRFLRERPNEPQPHLELARALRASGRSDAAIGSYRRYLALEQRATRTMQRGAAVAELRALGGEVGAVAPTPTVGARAGANASTASDDLLSAAPTAGRPTTAAQGAAASPRAAAPAALPADVFAKAMRAAGIASGTGAAVPPTEKAAIDAKASAATSAADRRAAALQAKRDALQAKRDALQAKRDALQAKREAARLRREEAKRKRQEAARAREAARQQRLAQRRAQREAARRQREADKLAQQEARRQRAEARRLGLAGATAGAIAASVAEDLPAASAPPVGSSTKPAPDAAQALVAVADRQFAKRRYLVALGIYRQAVRLDPSAPTAAYKAGLAAVAAGRMHLAAALFARVVKQQPENAAAVTSLQMASKAAGDRRPSREHVRGVIAEAERGLADGRYAEVEQQLTRLTASVADARVFLLRARARLALRKTQAALADAGRALALDPRLVRALLAIGDAHRQLGTRRRALYYYRLYLARSEKTEADARERVKRLVQSLEGSR